MNSENNSPTKSPNYIKMNFILEKLNERAEELSPLKRSIRHTVDPIIYDSIIQKKDS